MASICSTCKYNGGCFGDLREVFNIPESTPKFWDSFIFCKRPGTEVNAEPYKSTRITFNDNTALVIPAKTLKDCNLWEANNGTKTD